MCAIIAFCMPSFGQGTLRARSTALADRFAFFCLQAAPDFSMIKARSEAMGLKVIENRELPLLNGEKFEQTNWLVQDPTGEFVLLAQDIKGLKHVIGCGIAARDADGRELMMALSKHPRLGHPVKQIDDPNTGMVIWWNLRFGTKLSWVMLAYNGNGQQGVALNLIYTRRDN